MQAVTSPYRGTDLRSTIRQRGYVVVEGIGGPEAGRELLASLGVVIPQYDGRLTHEVRYQEQHQSRLYSQSANELPAHTEASGWQPPPAFLALYCHRQARCGGGHTDLLTVESLLQELDSEEAATMTDEPMLFPWPLRGSGTGAILSVMLGTTPDGERLFRFNANVLTSNAYDPVIGTRLPADQLPLGERGRMLAQRVQDIFLRRRVRFLIPDGGLLIWDNRRTLHARSAFEDRQRHLTRYFLAEPAG